MEGSCTQVTSGSFVDGSNATVACDSAGMTNCATCKADGSECFTCDTLFYLSDSTTCTACSTLSNCVDCSDADTCTECAATHFPEAGICVLRTTVIPGCVNCDDNTACTACDTGFYLDPSGVLCRPCPSSCSAAGCTIAASVVSCTACATGYVSVSSVCTPCAEGCDGCTGAVEDCDACLPGYQSGTGSTCVLDTACTAANCVACDATVSGFCISCRDGFYPLNGECVACEAPCASCDFDIDARYTARDSAITALYTTVHGQLSDATLIAALPSVANVADSAPPAVDKKNLYFTAYILFDEIITGLGFGDTAFGDAL